MESYHSDAPISEPEGDLFQRWPFSQRIAQIIAERSDPSSITIGINGAWGEGKTTVLNFIEHALNNFPRVVCMRFNPWRFASEEQLLRHFFLDLAGLLERSITTSRENFGDLVKRYGIPFTGAIGQRQVAEGIASLFGSAELVELRNRIERVLAEEGRRVVVLVDDIDRLEREEVHAVFRLVKLTADFQYVAYVLAFDEEVVSAALQERYGNRNHGAGRSFLEKIIQIPLHLPEADPITLRQLCFDGIQQALDEAGITLDLEQNQSVTYNFVNGLEVYLKTPRQAKLYSNALAFALPLLQGEANPVDQILIEGIRVFNPKLYRIIKENPGLFLNVSSNVSEDPEALQQRTRDFIESAINDLDPAVQKGTIHLLHELFPRLNGVSESTYSGTVLAKHQRIAAPEYFPRFFSYAVSKRDAPDLVIRSLVDSAGSRSDNEVRDQVIQLLESHNPERLIFRLRRSKSEFAPANARSLALVMAQVGETLPDNPDESNYLRIFSQAAMLVGDLVDVVPDQERAILASQVIREANPLNYAEVCLRWITHINRKRTGGGEFSDEERRSLGEQVAERVSSCAATGTSLLNLYGRDARRLLGVWLEFADPVEVRTYLGSVLRSDPQSAVKLIRAFLPIHRDLTSGKTWEANFEESHYNMISKAIDPDLIQNALLHTFANSLEPKVAEDETNQSWDITVAQDFLVIHHLIRSSKGQSCEAERGGRSAPPTE